MNEKPILFSGEMVQAILDGRKTQTRRVVKNAPTGDSGRLTWKPQRNRDGSAAINGFGHLKFVTDAGDCFGPVKCPYGKVGDRLWVRYVPFTPEPRTAMQIDGEKQNEWARHQRMLGTTYPTMALVEGRTY